MGNSYTYRCTQTNYERYCNGMMLICRFSSSHANGISRKVWHDPVHIRDPTKESATLRECFKYLDLTSRSFSAVIQELNPELLVPVALFYLILRGLDTIEDDMTIPLEKKEPYLRNFQNIIEEEGWTFNDNGPAEKDRELLVHFDCVVAEFNKINPVYKDIIKDITEKMGNGMADYANNAEHNINGVNTIKDYELYCHYVAGLVGDGLTRLFVESKLANPALLQRPELSESMGQFLQKTNIIRDIREDFDDKRRFWPKEIWSKHVDKFEDLFDPKNLEAALNCSSEMVLNSLRHADECLFYLAGIKDQSVFNFTAIPQSMAIATLELVFRNPEIFKKNVKITKGDACDLMMKSSQNLRTVCDVFKHYARRINKRNTPKDPNFLEISIACAKVQIYLFSDYGQFANQIRWNNLLSKYFPLKIPKHFPSNTRVKPPRSLRKNRRQIRKTRKILSSFSSLLWEHYS